MTDFRKYSISEFAKEVGVSVSTLRRWDACGKVVARRYPSGRWYYVDSQIGEVCQDMSKPYRVDGSQVRALADQRKSPDRVVFDLFQEYLDIVWSELCNFGGKDSGGPRYYSVEDLYDGAVNYLQNGIVSENDHREDSLMLAIPERLTLDQAAELFCIGRGVYSCSNPFGGRRLFFGSQADVSHFSSFLERCCLPSVSLSEVEGASLLSSYAIPLSSSPDSILQVLQEFSKEHVLTDVGVAGVCLYLFSRKQEFFRRNHTFAGWAWSVAEFLQFLEKASALYTISYSQSVTSRPEICGEVLGGLYLSVLYEFLLNSEGMSLEQMGLFLDFESFFAHLSQVLHGFFPKHSLPGSVVCITESSDR